MPPTEPATTDHQMPLATSRTLTTANEAAMNSTAEPIVPMRSASAGCRSENTLTNAMPASEQSRPIEASASGRNIRSCCEPSAASTLALMVEAMAMVAICAPQYDSKMSEPMPATSPTLSPTLSAITPGLRGSSSGIPASTLPTRSAPTSAALVKMPPPTR